MNKENAYQMVLQLLDAAVKGGLFKSAADVYAIGKAVEMLKPEVANGQQQIKDLRHEKIN
jgi:hypothetical protein